MIFKWHIFCFQIYVNIDEGAKKLIPQGCQDVFWDEATWHDDDYYPGILYLLEQYKYVGNQFMKPKY